MGIERVPTHENEKQSEEAVFAAVHFVQELVDSKKNIDRATYGSAFQELVRREKIDVDKAIRLVDSAIRARGRYHLGRVKSESPGAIVEIGATVAAIATQSVLLYKASSIVYVVKPIKDLWMQVRQQKNNESINYKDVLVEQAGKVVRKIMKAATIANLRKTVSVENLKRAPRALKEHSPAIVAAEHVLKAARMGQFRIMHYLMSRQIRKNSVDVSTRED
jgi:hypothetical protein